MEVEVVCLVNPTQELVIEPNLTQEPKVKTNFDQELVVETIEVQNAIARTLEVFPIANMLLLPSLPTRKTIGTTISRLFQVSCHTRPILGHST
jgi:hypothetical protein